MPTIGNGVPRLLKYMTMMLFLATFVLVETILLKLFTLSSQDPPLWMKSVSNFLSTNSVLRIFVYAPFNSSESEGESRQEINVNGLNIDATAEVIKVEGNSKFSKTAFCRFVDRVLFIFLIFCYYTYDGY